ncbi:MAG: hypothetical protein JWM53_4694 [bacterium]|nr:hypothetical protein [bacterium]
MWDDATHAPLATALQEIREIAPGLLRFPGGTRAMRYHFDQARGATRTPQCDPFKGALDATTYGPDEFLAIADGLGADVSWVAPWVDGSPDESARIATFLADKPAVKLLEIGNEPYLGLPAGPASGSCGRPSQVVQDERWDGATRIPTSAADYAAQLAATATLVRAAAPSLRIGAPATSQYDGSSDAMTAAGDVDAAHGGDAWNARLLSDARDAFDTFVLHPYDFSVDDDARMHLADRARKTVHDLRAAAPEKQIAITEYGMLFGGGTLLNALVTVDMTRMAIEEQLAMSVRHILIETDAGGPFADSAAIGPGLAREPGHRASALLAMLEDSTAFPTAELVTDGTLVALPARFAGNGPVAVLLLDRRIDDGSARDVRLTLPPGSYRIQTVTLAGALTDKNVELASAELGAATGSVHLSVGAHSAVVVVATPQ